MNTRNFRFKHIYTFRLFKSRRACSRQLLIACFLVIASAGFLPAQIQLANPSIPNKEIYTYQHITEEKSEHVHIEVELVESPLPDVNGHTRYFEYRMRSNSKDVLVRFKPDTLEAFRSEVWQRDLFSTIHRLTETVDQNKSVGVGELLICDINGIEMSLRGFPWNTENKADLIFLTNSDQFQFKMKIKDRQTIRINGSSYSCYEVELALGGILGSFFPKSYFWYSMDRPHILVKAEAAGMMGADSYELQLISYSYED